MKDTARAAKKFGVPVVNGFTGSSVWGKLSFFPPTSQADIDAGYKDFADRWTPIFDVFQAEWREVRARSSPDRDRLRHLHHAAGAGSGEGSSPAFGFNFDPSHFIHQFINPVFFIEEFGDRIFNVHVKESVRNLNGRNTHPARRIWTSAIRAAAGISSRRATAT